MNTLQATSRIYVAGHRGLVGSAIVRRLQAAGHGGLITRTHAELDLTDARATQAFFEAERPEFVFLAAAKVGGIAANQGLPAEFIHDNLAIQTSVIHSAWRSGVKRLLFLGSSCIYPKAAPQPMREADLLTGPLEPTNRPYALAKIAGIELCWSCNREHGTRFLAVMPCNLYGEGDSYDPELSHVIPGLLRRFHAARVNGDAEVVVWGSGEPRREFLHADDLAAAALHLARLPDADFDALLGDDGLDSAVLRPPLVNIGMGHDIRIADLAAQVARVVGFDGRIVFDRSRPDGTPRKLLDVSRIRASGWAPRIALDQGLPRAYADFLTRHA